MNEFEREKIFQLLRGDLKPKINTEICKIHRSIHPDCVECLSYKDCKEYISRILDYTGASCNIKEEEEFCIICKSSEE